MAESAKRFFRVLVLVFLCSTRGLCNTDNRYWKLASGETFHAELVRYDPVEDVAVLRINEEEERTYSLEDFSPMDSAWLLEWAEVSADLDDLVLQMEGQFSHYQHQGEHVVDFYAYTPNKHRTVKELPLLILFHPGGKGARYVKRLMPAAEELDLILVSSDAFRNGPTNLELFEELLPSIEATVPHDGNRLFMGGASGGAMKAYGFSAHVDRPWAGILANGGWLGGEDYYDLPYCRGMRVAMLNGHKDRAANRWIKPDAEVLEARGCSVNIFAFEGTHQIPSAEDHIEALGWLLDGEEQGTDAESSVPDPE